MNGQIPRSLLIASLLAFVAFALLGWSMMRLDAAREAVIGEAGTLQDVETLARQIEAGRRVPMAVSDRELESTLLARLIEQSADQAGVPRRALDRIWPQPPRRVTDTPYLRASTQLLLREVTLPQAAKFLEYLATASRPLSIDAVRFSAPRSEPTATNAETWTLEATISHLHYQPAAESNPVARKD